MEKKSYLCIINIPLRWKILRLASSLFGDGGAYF